MIIWWHWDVADYKLLPFVTINEYSPSVSLGKNPNEKLIAALFEKNGNIQNFEKYLLDTDTTSFIVVRDDKILYESYPRGNPPPEGYHSFSVTKSFISALVGIAIDEGYIQSVSDPITKYIPELIAEDNRFQSITIENLLRMASGIQYSCQYCELGIQVPWSDNVKATVSPNLRDTLIKKTIIAEKAGEYFVYKAYDPQLLSLILERSTGVSPAEYLQESIWKPAQMGDSATWMVDSYESGLIRGDLGIDANPLDYANLGRLYLHGGNLNGKQIISRNWISESTKPFKIGRSEYYSLGSDILATQEALFPNKNGRVYYSFLWWGATRDFNNYDFWAHGHLGQWIYVCPQKNLVIVRTGLNDGDKMHVNGLDWLKMFYNFAGDL
jgi:CubicO group peptidase (beta-lactamase class C family)